MTLFNHTDKIIDTLPDLTKEKKLSNLLGTNKLLNKIRSLPQNEFGNFRFGALTLTLILGASSYYFYWRDYQQKMKLSSGYYKLLKKTPINAGNQFLWDKGGNNTTLLTYYYRMPQKEFDIKYRLRSAYIHGEFDHDKEILLPTKMNGVKGYTVITPFYYYQKSYPSIYLGVAQNGTLFNSNDEARGAIAVKRGWIPAELKDRRLRPQDFNTGKREVLLGTVKLSENKRHDFNEPNDPARNYWNNFSLEDFSYYWALPNVLDSKYCYFEEIDMKDLGVNYQDVYPIRPTPTEAIVEDGKNGSFLLDRDYKLLKNTSFMLTTFFTYLAYLTA